MNQVNPAYFTTQQYSLQLCGAVYLCITSKRRCVFSIGNKGGRIGAHEWMLYSSFEKEIFIHGKWLYCDWLDVIHSAKTVIDLARVYDVCYLIWYILCLRCADPEAALQQQHGWTPFPLAISSRLCGVPASEQQGDPTVWQKQCARSTGNCLIPLIITHRFIDMK